MVLREWNKTLIWEAKLLMVKRKFSYRRAMNLAWEMNSKGIEKDLDVDVAELRKLFYKEGEVELERYIDELMEVYRGC